MKLNVYDPDFNRIAIIDNQFVSCLWQEGYNTVGSFAVELQPTPEMKLKIKPECYVGRPDRETLMVIKTVQYPGGTIVATGKPASRVLDDVAFIGTINAGDVVSASLRASYNASIKYRRVEFGVDDLPDTYPQQISNKSMLELCEAMCQSTDMGFKIVKAGPGALIKCYKPADTGNIKLSSDYGNLKDVSVTLSTEAYKNYAIVLGEGEGTSRVRVDVNMTNGADHRELVVDARDLQQDRDETVDQYHSRLTARGCEKLLEQQKTWKCSFTPGGFGVDYDLGDVVTVLLNDFGVKLQARITRFTQKEQRNQTETTIEVGNLTVIRR